MYVRWTSFLSYVANRGIGIAPSGQWPRGGEINVDEQFLEFWRKLWRGEERSYPDA